MRRVAEGMRKVAQAGVQEAALQLPARLSPDAGIRALVDEPEAPARTIVFTPEPQKMMAALSHAASRGKAHLERRVVKVAAPIPKPMSPPHRVLPAVSKQHPHEVPVAPAVPESVPPAVAAVAPPEPEPSESAVAPAKPPEVTQATPPETASATPPDAPTAKPAGATSDKPPESARTTPSESPPHPPNASQPAHPKRPAPPPPPPPPVKRPAPTPPQRYVPQEPSQNVFDKKRKK